MIKKSSMYKSISILISTILSLIWVMLISYPQEGEKKMILLTSIFFFPFFLFSLILFTIILSIEEMKQLKKMFLNMKIFLLIILALVILTLISFNLFFIELTFLSLLTNIFAFLFSVFAYYRLLHFLQ